MDVTVLQTILVTKLHSPPVIADLVARPQLYARLDLGLQHPLTLVSAPAGFGKSTLLSAWLARGDMRYAWLSLDAGDNDLAIFLNYFIEAVRTVHPGACGATEAMIHLATLPESTIIAHQLINELDALSGVFVLVLDDFHVISNRAIYELVTTLLRRPPRSLRLVIAARQDPALPLTSLRAQGQMIEIRSADLRFQPAETLAFIRQTPDLTIADADVTSLGEALEGWPAGLRLAALSLRLSGNPTDALLRSQADAVDYLFGEVLTTLPQDRQASLLKLAVVDRFCPELCDALCAPSGDTATWPGGQAFVVWLKTTNLFIVPLDDENHWFRFHHLFLHLLRQRLHAHSDADTLAELDRKAAAWLAAEGMVEEALHHFLRAGDLDAAARVMFRARTSVIRQEDWSRLARWVDLFPADYANRSPEVWVIKAWAVQVRFRLREVGDLLDQIETHWDQLCVGQTAAEVEILAAEMAALRCQNRFWAVDGAQCLALAEHTLAHSTIDYTGVYGNALLYYGLALQMTGRQADSFTKLTQALVGDEARQNPRFRVRVLISLAIAQWAAADLSAAERSARQLLQLGEQHHLLAGQGWGRLVLGCVYYARNQLADAAKYFGGLVEHPYGPTALAIIYGHCGLAMTYMAQRRAADAEAVLEAAYALATDTGNLTVLRLVQALEAHLALLQGKQAIAASWVDQHKDTRPWLPMYFAEIPALTWAKIGIAQGTQASLAQAAAVLTDLHNFVAETHNTIRLIDVLALKALLHATRGEHPAARGCLQQALALAEPGNIIRPFVDLGPDMAALLHEAAKQTVTAGYARHVLAAFPDQGIQGTAYAALRHAQTDALIEPLTDRELEVLALLNRRLSDKEIAQLLVISPVTVKTHMRHLFGKLQVNSRREAVARAQALGLLHST